MEIAASLHANTKRGAWPCYPRLSCLLRGITRRGLHPGAGQAAAGRSELATPSCTHRFLAGGSPCELPPGRLRPPRAANSCSRRRRPRRAAGHRVRIASSAGQKPTSIGSLRQALPQAAQQIAQVRRAAGQLQVGQAHHRHAAPVQRADRRARARRRAAAPGSQPMLLQQLRQHERRGLIERAASGEAQHRRPVRASAAADRRTDRASSGAGCAGRSCSARVGATAA